MGVVHATSYGGDNSLNHNVVFPQASAGNRLVLWACSSALISNPSGWTPISGGVVLAEAFYGWTKVSDGTEVGVTLNLSAAHGCAAVLIERDDMGAQLTGAQGGSATATGPNVTGLPIDVAEAAVVVAGFGKGVAGQAPLSAVWAAGWTEQGDIAEAAAATPIWVTAGDRIVDITMGTFTPGLVSSPDLPGGQCRTMVAAFSYEPPDSGGSSAQDELIQRIRKLASETGTALFTDDELSNLLLVYSNDVLLVAAEVLEAKAARDAVLVDITEDGSSRKFSTRSAAWLKLAALYRARSQKDQEDQAALLLRPRTREIVRPE